MQLQFTLRAQLAAPFLSGASGTRLFSSTTPGLLRNAPAKPRTLDPRWLTLIKRRIGKCMMFGLQPAQIDEGGKILNQLAKEWRELIAGSEGFLTDAKRRSLFRHGVVWGEQVRLWCLSGAFSVHIERVTDFSLLLAD